MSYNLPYKKSKNPNTDDLKSLVHHYIFGGRVPGFLDYDGGGETALQIARKYALIPATKQKMFYNNMVPNAHAMAVQSSILVGSTPSIFPAKTNS